MNSENVHSTQNPSASGDSSAGEKPPRSKVERLVVWTVIVLLVILTGMEALAQRGYSKSLEDFQTALDEAEEPLTLEDFETKYKSGLAIKSNGSKDGQSTILFKWPSLLRRYEMHFTLVPGDEQLLATYSTNDDPAGMIGRPDAGGDETGDEGGAGPEGPGMVGDGGDANAGGGPGGGGRGRRGPRGGNQLQRLLAENLQAELKLTDEQKTQIQDLVESQQLGAELSPEERETQREANRKAALEKLKELLDEAQFTRANQILLHARGMDALTQDDVAEALKLTPEQRKEIAALIQANRDKRTELFQARDFEGIRALRDELNKQLLAVLSAEQQQAWNDLLGPAPPEQEAANRPERPE